MQRSLRNLALAMTVLTLGAAVWIALSPRLGGEMAPQGALAGAMPPVGEGAVVPAVICHTIDTSRPEWLGGAAYLPIVIREE